MFLLSLQFIEECDSKRIIKIGQRFGQVIAKINSVQFLWLTV